MTDETVFLEESGGAAPIKTGSRWLVTLAVPGKGSSGEYPETMLRETGPAAFPAGTKAFWGHTSRDARDMVGTYDDGAFWNEEEGKLQALLTPFPRYRDVLNEAGKNIEASIHAASTKDPRTGVVKSLNPHRANTVDLVAFGGLEGSRLEHQVESLFAAASADGGTGKEEENQVEITKEMWDAQSAALTTIAAKFDTFVAESKLQVQGVADEAALEAAVETRVEEALTAFAETEKAIDSADILSTQKESLKARARKGEDITSDLASYVTFVAEARKEFAPDPKGSKGGKVVVVDESLDSEPKSFRVGRWS